MTSATNNFSSNNGEENIPLLLVRHDNQLKRINFSDINYLESDGNLVKIYTQPGQVYSLQNSLVKMERLLPEALFMRIHKQFIVHIEKVEAISIGNRKVTIGNNELPLGRTFKEKLLNRFQILG